MLYGKDAAVLTPEKIQDNKPDEKKKEEKGAKDKNGNKTNANGAKKEGNGDSKKDADSKKKDSDKITEKKTDGKPADGAEDTKDSDEFTEDEDEQLMKMKNENSSWKAISESMGKSIPILKQRFNAIKPKDWRPNTGKPGDAPPQDAKEKDTKEAKDTNGMKGKEKKQKTKDQDDVVVVVGGDDNDDMTSIYELKDKQYKRKTSDKHFPPEVLQYATSFDNQWYWENMASRIFDRFGRRYTTEELKAKVNW